MTKIIIKLSGVFLLIAVAFYLGQINQENQLTAKYQLFRKYDLDSVLNDQYYDQYDISITDLWNREQKKDPLAFFTIEVLTPTSSFGYKTKKCIHSNGNIIYKNKQSFNKRVSPRECENLLINLDQLGLFKINECLLFYKAFLSDKSKRPWSAINVIDGENLNLKININNKYIYTFSLNSLEERLRNYPKMKELFLLHSAKKMIDTI